MNNMLGLYSECDVDKVEENNYSIISDDTDIWDGELPFKPGDLFPTAAIKERASISKTNQLIYTNSVDDIYNSIISIFPEIDPFMGHQIREIICKLPYFKNSVNAWVGLVAGDTPLIDTDNQLDEEVSELIDASNFAEIVQDEVRSRFMDVISAYRVDVDLNHKPIIVPIAAKNLIVYVNKDIPSSIEVVVVFSIYVGENGEKFVDFVEYHYDGKIVKHTMKYNNGTLGEYVKEPEESLAFEGKYHTSPIVVFKHNVIGNQIYGTDQFRYWSPSMLAGMRELQNVLRLGERTREMIRKVPNSAIKKNPADGSSVFLNKGTIGYENTGDGNTPDIEYVVPEIRMEEACKALSHAIKQIAMDTQLSIAFFDTERLGSNLSADSIRASMYPARLEAKRLTSEMKPPIKELIVKLGYIADIDLSDSKMTVEFYDGFPKDDYKDIEAIQKRLESKVPSITLEDAIMKLDRVGLRVARQKAAEIRGEQARFNEEQTEVVNNTNEEIEETVIEDKPADYEVFGSRKLNSDKENADLLTHELAPTAGKGDISVPEKAGDNTIWENQMYPKPRDIPQGLYKNMSKSEVEKLWTLKRMKTN